MYPAPTSMIPAQVSLARFLENGGNVFGNYPYWYLGTTPFRYLTGPIVPYLLTLIHRSFPRLNLFDYLFFLIVIAWILGGWGVYFLIKELAEEKLVAVLVSFFYLTGPIVPFLFRFTDGISLIAFSFLPYILLIYLKLLRNWTRKMAIFLTLAISFIILIDSLILSSLILGMTTIFLTTTGWKKAEEKLKQTFLIFTFSFLISTLWYTPAYWWRLLVSPSFAGQPLFKVISQLSQLLPISLAFGLAIVSGKIIKLKSQLASFCFYWLFIFGFLTLIRFISDPDFWLDWSGYGMELQFGIAIALGLLLRQRFKIRGQKADICSPSVFGFLRQSPVFCFRSSFFLALYFLLFTFLFNKYVLGTLQPNITQTVEYRIGSQLAKITKQKERIFLSGTTAFWLNAFFDLQQVRGGNDSVSVLPYWREAAWEIREGEAVGKSIDWLERLKIAYLVIHTQESKEFYHDFAHPEKFESVRQFKKVYDSEGDRIYQLLPE